MLMISLKTNHVLKLGKRYKCKCFLLFTVETNSMYYLRDTLNFFFLYEAANVKGIFFNKISFKRRFKICFLQYFAWEVR